LLVTRHGFVNRNLICHGRDLRSEHASLRRRDGGLPGMMVNGKVRPRSDPRLSVTDQQDKQKEIMP
jgi:hypothetical protein